MSDYHMYVGADRYAGGRDGHSAQNINSYSATRPQTYHGHVSTNDVRMGHVNAAAGPYTPSKHSSYQSSLAASPSRDPHMFVSPRLSESPNRFARASPAGIPGPLQGSMHGAGTGVPQPGETRLEKMQSDAMMYTIAQLQNDLRNVKDMVQAKNESAANATQNPLEAELEKVKNELQSRYALLARI
jgi:hypothetical protein